MDDEFKIFAAEVANAGSRKQRAVIKKSEFKGVSKNGLKWQVR